MKKIVRSARGQVIDFNLLHIHQQMASMPKPSVVAAREDFVDKKLKRRLKRATQTTTEPIVDSGEPTLDDNDDTTVQE